MIGYLPSLSWNCFLRLICPSFRLLAGCLSAFWGAGACAATTWSFLNATLDIALAAALNPPITVANSGSLAAFLLIAIDSLIYAKD